MATYEGHDATVWSVVANETLLLSGSADTTIRIWDIHKHIKSKTDRVCVRVVQGHKRTVRCLRFGLKNEFASASADYEVRVWVIRGIEGHPFKHVTCRWRFIAHGCPVTCLEMKGVEIVSGGEDGKICLWDLERGVLVRKCEGHEGAVQDLKFDSTKVY